MWQIVKSRKEESDDNKFDNISSISIIRKCGMYNIIAVNITTVGWVRNVFLLLLFSEFIIFFFFFFFLNRNVRRKWQRPYRAARRSHRRKHQRGARGRRPATTHSRNSSTDNAWTRVRETASDAVVSNFNTTRTCMVCVANDGWLKIGAVRSWAIRWTMFWYS